MIVVGTTECAQQILSCVFQVCYPILPPNLKRMVLLPSLTIPIVEMGNMRHREIT